MIENTPTATVAEECDDGNLTDGDGCASDCTVEVEEWGCDGTYGELSSCYLMCGNGRRDQNGVPTPEECDDGNYDNGDGCADDCTVEDAEYGCDGDFGELSTCYLMCGNGLRDQTGVPTPEECDDGNYDNGDGCADDCTVELEWGCTGGFGVLSACEPQCGNGLKEDTPTVVATEECDDGNYDNGDGCDEFCAKEDEWGCIGDFGELSVCTPMCGNGL